MRYVYWDYECFMSSEVTLRKMTLRQYLAAAPILGCSFAVDDSEVLYLHADDPLWVEWAAEMRSLAADENTVFVGHNNSFDARCWRFGWTHAFGPLNGPQPKRVHCSLELAMAAWPNQPGGYGLANLAKVMGFPPKLEIDLKKPTRAQLGEYCKRDTEICRLIHRAALDRLPDCEVRIAEMANRVRRNYFVISPERVEAALTQFGTAAASAVKGALAHIGRDGEDAFGWDGIDGGRVVRSVKPHKIKELLLMNLGFEAPTISLKKINPARLLQSAEATVVLRETSRVNKMLSHKRRVKVFQDSAFVDIEHGYFRAHTGRYSSPSTGRGVNALALPKNDKAIAKPVRQLFRLPDHLCFVRADAANVEYRVTAFLTDAEVGRTVFEKNPLADPYAVFWLNATGQVCSKKENIPARQVAKAAVLALSFFMGIGRWMVELAKFVADPENKLSIGALEAIATAQKWTMPNDRWVKGQRTKYAIPDPIAVVAYHTRQLFHQIHPEFGRLGQWFDELIVDVCRSTNPERAIEAAYRRASAPNRRKIDVILDPELDRPTLRLVLGGWPAPTVAWRDIGIHADCDGVSTVQAGNKGYRTIHKSIEIENAVQSAARNALVMAQCALEDRGYEDIFSVHDEVLLIVPKTREAVLKARQDLIDVMGPGNNLGWGWSFVALPHEITCSASMFEDEKLTGDAWWADLARGNGDLLASLP